MTIYTGSVRHCHTEQKPACIIHIFMLDLCSGGTKAGVATCRLVFRRCRRMEVEEQEEEAGKGVVYRRKYGGGGRRGGGG